VRGGGKGNRKSADGSHHAKNTLPHDERLRDTANNDTATGVSRDDAADDTSTAAAPELTARKRAVFLAITLALPLLLLALLEVGLRVFDRSGGNPLVVEAPFGDGSYVIANPQVGVRWFGTANAPSARVEPFLLRKPEGALRVIALGESSTYGFPHPPTASFPRVLSDMLRDVQPGRVVEVINLGIPATNSWTLRDIAGEVLKLEPDMVLVYAGHNEYYGALGVASTAGGGAGSALVRATLALQRLRLGQLVQGIVSRLRGTAPGGVTEQSPVEGSPGEGSAAVATYMETIADQEPIELGDDTYVAGVRQFRSNLAATLSRFREAGVPVLVGSLTSNIRDQPPLASPANDLPGAAREVYESAMQRLQHAAVAGDSAALRDLFVRARDMDVVRFRAPSVFDTVVMDVAARQGAVYVPVRERFVQEASGGIPGSNLFTEHVHPDVRGQAILADEFASAIRNSGLLADAQWERRRSLDAYVQEMGITRFDSLLTAHTIRTVTSRWPFVPVADARDYRGTYEPVDMVDSLAFLASRGGVNWLSAKGMLADAFMQSGSPAAAAAEYAGIVREAPPMFEEPRRRYAEALLRSGQLNAAEKALADAQRIQPTPAAEILRAQLLLARGDTAGTVNALRDAVETWPDDAALHFQLSLAYALSGDMNLARSEALHVLRVRRDFPGLVEWLRTISPEQ